MSHRRFWPAAMHHPWHHTWHHTWHQPWHQPAVPPRQTGRPRASLRRTSDLIIGTTIAVFLLASIIEIGSRWLAAAFAP